MKLLHPEWNFGKGVAKALYFDEFTLSINYNIFKAIIIKQVPLSLFILIWMSLVRRESNEV